MLRTTRRVLLILIALLPASLATFAFAGEPMASSVHSLDGDGWRIATDPKNEGREAKWFAAPRAEAKPTKVPWIIQDAFPGYHGVAWYWREFDAPANPHAGGRSLLRFWAVDYLAEVWLNGTRVGGHEGGETPFVLDVTDAIRPGAKNLLAVRVLNPTHERIDGIVLNETPKQARVIPYSAGAAYNHGGITGSVELLAVPAVRVEDLFARADPKTGIDPDSGQRAQRRPRRRRAADWSSRSRPAAGGETLRAAVVERELPPGDTLVETELKLDQPRLWELNDPFLYRVTARVTTAEPGVVDERSVRCGFRDFRFENGCFRLNGRRLFLRSTHTCNHFPVGLKLPPDPRHGPARSARREGDGLQHDPLHLGRRGAVSARPLRRDRADGLRGIVRVVARCRTRRSWRERWERCRRGADPPRPQSSQRRHLGTAQRDSGQCRTSASRRPRCRWCGSSTTRAWCFSTAAVGIWPGANDERVRASWTSGTRPAGREPWVTLNPSAAAGRDSVRFHLAGAAGGGSSRTARASTASCAGRRRRRIATPSRPRSRAWPTRPPTCTSSHNGRPLFDDAAQPPESARTRPATPRELTLAAGRHGGFRRRLGQRQLRQRQHRPERDHQVRRGQDVRPGRRFPRREESRRAVGVRLARAGRRNRTRPRSPSTPSRDARRAAALGSLANPGSVAVGGRASATSTTTRACRTRRAPSRACAR